MLKKVFGTALGIVLAMGSIGIVMGQADGGGTFVGGRTDVNPAVPGAEGRQGEGFLATVQYAVNWVLGLLGLIALIILLWGGFLMITAAGDDTRYKKGFTILKQAAIGLIFIGVAWLIVSIIFQVIEWATGAGSTGGTGG